MTRLIAFFVIYIISVNACVTQNQPDTLVVNDFPDCEFIAASSAGFIMYYFARQDMDSAEIVLNDWEAACGTSEPILRTRILFAIYKESFSESLYDSTIIDCVLDYAQRMKSDSILFNYYPGDYGYVPVKGNYDYFTQTIADTLLTRVFYNPVELYFSELYANVLPDPFTDIQTDTIYQNSGFRSYYYQKVDKYRYKPDFNLNLFTGIWMPFDNAAILGNHPLIGCQLGMHSQKMTYNLSFYLKFGKSKNEYEILRNGNVETTSDFVGGYIGADIEREMLKFSRNAFNLLGGFGFDGFDAIKVNTEDTDPENDVGFPINSLNINFGLGYRYYLRYKRYFTLQGKYNFVNYNNKGGTNLSGNCITVSLMFGGFFNETKDRYLSRLNYIE